MLKLCGKNNKLSAMCLHWDGYRLSYVAYDEGTFFKYDNTKKVKCMNPQDFEHFEKRPYQMYSRFGKKILNKLIE